MRRLAFFLSLLTASLQAAPDGAALYQQNCAMCHGTEGLGMAGIFPPLAKSDYLVAKRLKALRAPMEGLNGEITVNGVKYNGAMPAAFLDDAELAAVFNHVFTSFGNDLEKVTTEEITRIRATTSMPTIADLKRSMVGATLPDAPPGWKLSVGAELPFSPSRLALHPDGRRVLALSVRGDVWSWQPGGPDVTKIINGDDYLDRSLGEAGVMGMGFDSDKRLYITSNQCNKSVKPVRNDMFIFRTAPWPSGEAPKPRIWYKASNPYGVGPYNHGLSHIAQGPDGMMYINSGARTDSGEKGTNPDYSTIGETETTAVMWRMDPEDETPEVEVIARGLRNSYGFCWDDQKRLVATDNGPDAHTPEELNFVEPGKHYGFPFKYSDVKSKPYPHTPDAPAGLKVTLPFKNLGPDAGKDRLTFDPHSCPTGIIWLDKTWPAPLGGSYLTTRFGNMLKLEGGDVGYDLLQLNLNFDDRTLTSRRLISPLGRPVDLITFPGHRIIIAEYSRATNLAAGVGTPGRLLLLEPK